MPYGRFNHIILCNAVILHSWESHLVKNTSRVLKFFNILALLKYTPHTLTHYCDNVQDADGQVSTPSLSVCHFSLDVSSSSSKDNL